jgi:hypothetical protein
VVAKQLSVDSDQFFRQEFESMASAKIGDLLEILFRLKSANIYYRLSDHTPGAIMIEVAMPGERWEIELHDDGRIGV